MKIKYCRIVCYARQYKDFERTLAFMDAETEYKMTKILHKVMSPNVKVSKLNGMTYRMLPNRPAMVLHYEPDELHKVINTDTISKEYQIFPSQFVEFLYDNGAAEVDATGRKIKQLGVTHDFRGSAINHGTRKIESIWMQVPPQGFWKQVKWDDLTLHQQEDYMKSTKMIKN